MLTGVDQERKVVGNAFALGANKMSVPEGILEYMLLKRKHNESSSFRTFLLMCMKVKAQSAGDVNRVLPALKTMQQLKTIENNLITSYLK
jgi:peptidyl-prolyl cis-trans isomerase D